jgi:hypothetical protein
MSDKIEGANLQITVFAAELVGQSEVRILAGLPREVAIPALGVAYRYMLSKQSDPRAVEIVEQIVGEIVRVLARSTQEPLDSAH